MGYLIGSIYGKRLLETFSHFSSNLTERSQDMLFTILSIKIIQMVKYGSLKMLIQEIGKIISPWFLKFQLRAFYVIGSRVN